MKFFAAIILAATFLLVACNDAAPPTPSPTPAPTPTPTATPTPVAARDSRVREMAKTHPFANTSLLYVDIEGIRANARLVEAADPFISAYLGGLGRVAASSDMVGQALISLNSPAQLVVRGNFNGSLIIGLLGLSGYSTGTYGDVRLAQINKTIIPGAPNFVAFPQPNVAVLAEDQKGVEKLVDVQTGAGGMSALDREEVKAALSKLGTGHVIAFGRVADIQALVPGLGLLKASYGGFSFNAPPTGGSDLDGVVYLLFSREEDSQAAEKAVATPASLAALLRVDPALVKDLSVQRNGRELVLKAKVPIAVVEAVLKAQSKPS